MTHLRRKALHAAQPLAAQLAEAFRAGPVSASNKTNHHDLVSAWDQRVEEHLKAELVGDGAVFWGEETGRQPVAPGQLQWLVDPIDGTSNFVHGYPMFSISIAAVRDDEVIAAVVVDPMAQDVYSADPSGAYLNDAPLIVRPVPEHTAQYNLVTSFPAGEILHRAPEAVGLFGTLVTEFATVRRLVSGALELCYAARGIADVVLGVDTKPWDVAAGGYILAQAGGAYHTAVAGPKHLAPHYLAVAPGRNPEPAREVFDQICRL